METRALGPGFGAEVTGVDLSRPVSAADAEVLRGLLDRHELLLLRFPNLEAAAHIDFVGLFGPVVDEFQDESRFSYVSNVVGLFGDGRLLFHQDAAFTPFPNEVQSLYAQDLEGDAVPTLFVSNTRAFLQLSPAQRESWDGLKAVHARDGGKTGRADDEFVRVRLLDLPDGHNEARYPRAVHKVLQRHPRTGAPLLFVNEYYTSHVLDLAPEAGEQVIKEACAALYQPGSIYRHAWRPGDLLVWDNIALQHARSMIKPNTRRTLRRVVVNENHNNPEFRERAAARRAGAMGLLMEAGRT